MHDENAMKEAPVKEVMRKSRTSEADHASCNDRWAAVLNQSTP